MASWPGTLPSAPLANSFIETLPDLAIRTEMDVGPAKMRRRSTAGPRPCQMSFLMTAAQVAALDTFYVTTIKSGADSFTFTHPRTGVSGTWRIVNPPRWKSTGVLYQVSIDMELLP